MKPPSFVRPLTHDERQALKAGLRSPDADRLHPALLRCQILLQSAEGHQPRAIAAGVDCCVQSVRNAIRVFEAQGLACLGEKSSRPGAIREAFDDGFASCSTAARATSASRRASARWRWPPRWRTARA